MKAEDQYHAGIVVDDFEGALGELTSLFGYRWCEEFRAEVPVRLPGGETTLGLRFTYSVSTPRLEIIQTVPGTVWEPVEGSGIHHLGYWSEDVDADSAALARRGMTLEASGLAPDGTVLWAYHRGPSGPRIELVRRSLAPVLEQWWASGADASGVSAS